MSSFRKFWVFKNITNFTITVIGTAGIGLIYNSAVIERKFANNPIVNEAIKIVGLNDHVKDVIGSPISYSGSTSNTFSIRDNEHYYHFQTRANRGNSTNVEVNATGLKVSEILERKKMEEINQELTNSKENMNKYDEQIKQSKRGERKKLENAKKNEVERIKQLNEQKKKLEDRIQKNLDKYYIPSEEVFYKVIKCQNPQTVLPDDTIIYGIDALSLNLPNRTLLPIIPPQNQAKIPAPTKKSPQSLSNITLGDLKNRLNQNLADMTEQQLAAYGKHKTHQMYTRYSNYRVLAFLMFGMSMVLGSIYFHKNRLRPVSGTILVHEAENYFMENKKIKRILVEMNKNKLKWDKSVAGGMKKDDFECEIRVEGISEGKVILEGTRDQTKFVNEYRKFVFQYKKDNQIKKVDLLA